jgi:hypothetical protein
MLRVPGIRLLLAAVLPIPPCWRKRASRSLVMAKLSRPSWSLSRRARPLKNTLVIAMGEFGRTPKINAVAGRDHWGSAYSIFVSGAGVAGGQNIGATDETAGQVKDYPCTIDDLMNQSPMGRPVRLANSGQIIKKLFG